MDTESFIFHMKIEDIYKDIIKDVEKGFILQNMGKKNRYMYKNMYNKKKTYI